MFTLMSIRCSCSSKCCQGLLFYCGWICWNSMVMNVDPAHLSKHWWWAHLSSFWHTRAPCSSLQNHPGLANSPWARKCSQIHHFNTPPILPTVRTPHSGYTCLSLLTLDHQTPDKQTIVNTNHLAGQVWVQSAFVCLTTTSPCLSLPMFRDLVSLLRSALW